MRNWRRGLISGTGNHRQAGIFGELGIRRGLAAKVKCRTAVGRDYPRMQAAGAQSDALSFVGRDAARSVTGASQASSIAQVEDRASWTFPQGDGKLEICQLGRLTQR